MANQVKSKGSKKVAPKADNEIQVVHPDAMKDKPVCPMSGSKQAAFSQQLTQQIASTLWLGHSDEQNKTKRIQAAIVGMMGIQPKDEMEGMLAAQMVALHHASMECLRRAMLPEQTFEGRQMSLSQANKLSRSYALLMEALDRHRGKKPSEQKVTVEHVHVYQGGQAIVGNVTHPAGAG